VGLFSAIDQLELHVSEGQAYSIGTWKSAGKRRALMPFGKELKMQLVLLDYLKLMYSKSEMLSVWHCKVGDAMKHQQ
jgi:hypothetical protein